MDFETCSACGTRNDAGASFCLACGVNLAPRVHCPACNTLNGLGQRFCTRCGGALEQAGWTPGAPAGAVIDGVWERGQDEILRRVEPEEARRFLGTRTVRVPAGSVGVVLVDGVVERVLPPGEQTTLGLFERITSFFLRRERTAFYLVDQRPFQVPFVVRTRPNAAGHAVKSQVLVTFTLPRGDRAGLATFIANVLGDRPVFTTGDLYNLLRPDIVRIAQTELERALGAGSDLSYPDAEVAIRRALADLVGPRYGIDVEATLAPLTSVASLNFHLGTGAAPAVRPCVACAHELPASLGFCDGCGAKQPVVVTPAGATLSEQTPLFTSDGQQVELDVVVRVQGQSEDFEPSRIAPALVGAVAAHLRGRTFAELVGDFAALERDATAATAEALRAYGLTLVAIALVDVRSKLGQWVLAARADLERAAEDVRLGLAWLEHRDTELDLEQLVLTRVLREQHQQRDHAFARDAAATADRERRDDLAGRAAALDVTAARRDGATRAAQDSVEHDRLRRETAIAIELRAGKLESELAERRRREQLELELVAAREAQQLEKLRGMAELDRMIAAQEHAHELEKRGQLQGLSPEAMIAVQAAELSRAEGGGAAWANALAVRGGADTERRHGEELRAVLERQHAGNAALMDRAMAAMSEVAKSRAEAAPLAAGTGPIVTVASTTEIPTKPCPSCGARCRADAAFCGACGKTTP